MSDFSIQSNRFNHKPTVNNNNVPAPPQKPQPQDEVAKQLAAMQGLKPRGV